MTEKQKELTVGGLLAVFLLWLLWHFLRPVNVNTTASEPPEPLGGGIVNPNINISDQHPSCNCGPKTDCAINVNQIPTLNKILSLGTTYANAVYDAGNATLRAIAETSASPLITATVG